jgi:hypothetical protein
MFIEVPIVYIVSRERSPGEAGEGMLVKEMPQTRVKRQPRQANNNSLIAYSSRSIYPWEKGISAQRMYEEKRRRRGAARY